MHHLHGLGRKAVFAGLALLGMITPVASSESEYFEIDLSLLLSHPDFLVSQSRLTFSDVPSNFWASQYIQRLALQGIISGYPSGEFRPNEAITRAEFAALLGKAFSQPQVRNFRGFSDVPSWYWGFEAVREAYTSGFLSGYPDNQFRPNQNISRGEVLVSLVSGLNYMPDGVPAEIVSIYQDANQMPAWMTDKIASATERRMVVNYPDVQTLDHRRSATRAEVAAMIYQALVSLGEASQIVSEYVPGVNSDLSAISASTDTLKRISQSEREATAFDACYHWDGTPLEFPSAVGAATYNDTATAIANDPLLECSGFDADEVSAVAYLSNGDWVDFEESLNTLVQSESSDSVVALTELLQENDHLLHEAAVYGLGQKGAAARAAIPELVQLLQTSESAAVRVDVVRALDAIALTDDEVTAAIVTALESDESIDVQLSAIQALRKIDAPSATVIYALVEAFSSFGRDSQVSFEASKALEGISLENMNREAVGLLIANFRDSNESILYDIEYCSLPKEILSRDLPVMSQLSESEQSQVQEILATECWTIAASSVPEFVASLRRRWPW
jgi:hypothetical protein